MQGSFRHERRFLTFWKLVVRTLVALVTIAATMLPSSPVASAGFLVYTFTGDGWGHGLGMSQYGAKGGAEAGAAYNQILTHYYQGTAVNQKPMPPEIRVGLAQEQPQIVMSGNGKLDFVMDGAVVASAPADQNWSVTPTATGAYLLRAADGTQWTLGDPGKWLEVRFEEFGTLLRTTGHSYKYGWLELNTHLVNGAWRLRAILHVAPFERYLYGLGEMPSSWHMEALKAQAVAGRTFAVEKMARLGIRSECNCHLYATTFDQAYVGYDKELGASADRWKSAVDSTAGVLVLYNDSPIQAYYSSSSGGHTEHNENVWGGSPIPYLRGVPDPWDAAVSPFMDWSVSLRDDQLEAQLNSFPSTAPGSLHSLELVDPRGVSGRVIRVIDSDHGGVRIKGTTGVKRVGGDTLRSVLGLRSTLFSISLGALEHPPGTLVKGSGPAIYLIVGGNKLSVPSSSALLSHAGWDEVLSTSNSELASYPAAGLGFRDGTLVGDSSDGAIYVVSEGFRRHIASQSLFDSLGYNSSFVKWVSPEELALNSRWKAWTDSAHHPDGTFLKSSADPQVWVIDEGMRRAVQSEAVFESWADWSEIVTGSASEIASYSQGDPLGFRDGVLVGQSSTNKVWVVSDGLRRHISSEAAFNVLYPAIPIRWVSDAELALNEEWEAISSSASHPPGTLLKGSGAAIYLVVGGTKLPVPSASALVSHAGWDEVVSISNSKLSSYPAAGLGFRDGSLVGDPQNGAIYTVSEGYRRHIATQSLFDSLGYNASLVKWATPEELALNSRWKPWTDSAHHPDGTFIKSSTDPQVWLIDDGKRRPVQSEASFESWADWSEVVTVPASEVASYSQGTPIGFRDGVLLGQSSTNKVWVVSDALRRHVTSDQVFNALGYPALPIRWVSDAELALNEEWEPIP